LFWLRMYIFFFDRGCQSIRAGCAGGEPGGGAARAQSVAERRPRTHPPTGVVMTERRRKSRRGGSDAPVAAVAGTVAPETKSARYCESVILRL
jgi:hypothetical protein